MSFFASRCKPKVFVYDSDTIERSGVQSTNASNDVGFDDCARGLAGIPFVHKRSPPYCKSESILLACGYDGGSSSIFAGIAGFLIDSGSRSWKKDGRKTAGDCGRVLLVHNIRKVDIATHQRLLHCVRDS